MPGVSVASCTSAAYGTRSTFTWRSVADWVSLKAMARFSKLTDAQSPRQARVQNVYPYSRQMRIFGPRLDAAGGTRNHNVAALVFAQIEADLHYRPVGLEPPLFGPLHHNHRRCGKQVLKA